MIDPVQLQRFVTAGITQSAVRLGRTGTGVTGMRAAARKFCSRIKFDELPEAAVYPKVLDKWTDRLSKELPEGGRRWGVARKCLNIFMRDASYNVHLCEMYPRLRLLERVLEVPLDSYTAAGLLGEDGAADFGLKGWDAIIRLTTDENQKFQLWAQIVADKKCILRAHLDLLYFPFP